jgi:hypothetical protein
MAEAKFAELVRASSAKGWAKFAELNKFQFKFQPIVEHIPQFEGLRAWKNPLNFQLPLLITGAEIELAVEHDSKKSCLWKQ